MKRSTNPREGTATQRETILQGRCAVTCCASLQSRGWKTRVGSEALLFPAALVLCENVIALKNGAVVFFQVQPTLLLKGALARPPCPFQMTAPTHGWSPRRGTAPGQCPPDRRLSAAPCGQRGPGGEPVDLHIPHAPKFC